MMTIPQQISARLASMIPNYRCRAMFDYGSRVYGYKAPDDYDMIVVIADDPKMDVLHDYFYEQHMFDPYNVTVVNESRFFELREQHEISILECLNLPEKNIPWMCSVFKDKLAKDNFEIYLPQLRNAISKTASNSYVKAKKKLIVEADQDLECSIKSLFHSLRILQFGIQLASTGKIQNFAESNSLYVDIIKNYQESHLNWDEIHKTMKPVYNELSSQFKQLAPKA